MCATRWFEVGNAGQRVQLKMRDGEDSLRNVEVDFVIAGTGYDANVSRLSFSIRRSWIASIA
jgi:lysine/ornithine N-monooxygenase